MKISYKVVGIRPEALGIQSLLEKSYGKSCSIIAFDGTNESIGAGVYSEEKTQIFMRRALSRGEIGCAMGHLLAYASAENEDWMIVLEDDVVISADPKSLESLLRHMPLSPTVVHFDDTDLPTSDKKFGKYSWHKRPFRTHAYAINRTAIIKILSLQKSVLTTADWPIQWKYLVKFYWINDETFSLADMESIIEADRRPLQYVEHNNFQIYHSKYRIFGRIERIRWGKKLVAIAYVIGRFEVYFKNLEMPFLAKIKTAAACAYSDIK
jgi:GR25 family glycosyltransferase involved in LPS biosynthesis